MISDSIEKNVCRIKSDIFNALLRQKIARKNENYKTLFLPVSCITDQSFLFDNFLQLFDTKQEEVCCTTTFPMTYYTITNKGNSVTLFLFSKDSSNSSK